MPFNAEPTVVTGSQTLTTLFTHYLVNAASATGGITLSLPADTNNQGEFMVVSRTDNSANAVTVQVSNAGQLIYSAQSPSGSSSYTLSALSKITLVGVTMWDSSGTVITSNNWYGY